MSLESHYICGYVLVTRRTVFSSEMTSYGTAWQSNRLRLIHALLINRSNFHGNESSQLRSKTNHYSRNHQITNHNSPILCIFSSPLWKSGSIDGNRDSTVSRWESKLIWLTWFPNSFGPRLVQTTVLGRVDIARKRLSHKTPSLHLFLYLENLFPSAPLHFFQR